MNSLSGFHQHGFKIIPTKDVIILIALCKSSSKQTYYSILSVDAHFWLLPTTYIDDNNRNCKLVCANTVMENL